MPIGSLQRGEMFIDNAINAISGARAERNVSCNGASDRLRVSLRWSEKKSLAFVRFYKHLAPIGRSQQCSVALTI
jgi:hypothetical protein